MRIGKSKLAKAAGGWDEAGGSFGNGSEGWREREAGGVRLRGRS